MPAHETLSVVGARPQFVKAAVVSRAVARHRAMRESSCIPASISTGDVRDFLRRAFAPPASYHLGIPAWATRRDGTDARAIDEVIATERPTWCGNGDTNSTVAAACGGQRHVTIAHVEDGVRSFNAGCRKRSQNRDGSHGAMALCPSETAVKISFSKDSRLCLDARCECRDVMYDVASLIAAGSAKDRATAAAVDGLDENTTSRQCT